MLNKYLFSLCSIKYRRDDNITKFKNITDQHTTDEISVPKTGLDQSIQVRITTIHYIEYTR